MVGTGTSGVRYQEPDYSLRGLFQQHHGDFLLKRQRFDPLIEVKGQLFPNAAINHEPGRFHLLRGTFDADLPMMVSTDGYLLTGLRLDARRYQFKNNPVLNDETLYQTGIKLGFGAFIDDNVLLEMSVEPTLFSDLDGTVHGKDLDFPARGLFTWRSGDDLFFKLGARYNEVYRDANILPLVGVSYMLSPEFRFDLMLPESAEISWWPDPGLGFLLGVDVQGAQYHVRTSQALGNQRDDVQVQEVLTYFGVMARPSDAFSLFGRVGLAVAGDYKLTNGAAGTNFVEGALDTGVFFEVGMGFDF